MIDDIHEQLGVNKSFLAETFAMIRVSKNGEVWVQYQDKIDIPSNTKAVNITADVLKIIALHQSSE
ncbi:hypothetical protein LL266_13330 [Vibrio anguillarum]|jgi:hypothetical protein|uniref:Uncharacterized protein n=2 Tax=Unclassified Bacteria TaxID=49928 RepID=A0AAU6UVQ0_UNCXX|nr:MULTISPECIES: hypothetical protein [Vibrionaceae]EKO3666167.1 hypothetical protein [Vibrio metschnikovii]MBY7890367.1 hypothetical protein [Vibrio fluvialis]GHW32464.1 hypothetical protein VCSRO150_3603 [Vibrio cholerae]ALM73058.1 hypothetical protein FORC9_3541 [Vibrio vulnificus]ANH65417.1 hypothetical protein FORC16_3534 [Vibrio vulnificus]